MTDQSQAKQEAGSADTQPASRPSAEQKTPKPAREGEASPRGERQPDQAGAEASLPEGVKERTTQQFEKLQKQLAEERAKRIRAEQVFSGIKSPPPAPAQPSQGSGLPDYYDPKTGEVDVLKLEAQNKKLRDQVTQLAQNVQGMADNEQLKQEQEAFDTYSSLDPKAEDFDQEFHNAVAGYLTNSLLKGERISFKEAADKVAGLSAKEFKKAEKAGAKQALEQLTPKEQASLEATGRSDRGRPGVDLEALRRQTRRGDMRAIIERMKSVPSK